MGDNTDKIIHTDRIIRKESDNYLQMAKLLKMKRPPETEELIKRVLDSKIPIEEKIRKIELIDAQEKGTEIQKETLTDLEVKNIIKEKKLSTEEITSRNRGKIKIKLFRNPFFIFIFKDYKKIREFGIKTGFINSRLIPPGFLLNFDGLKNLITIIQKDTVILLKKIDLILNKGWQVLDKSDYNLLVEFKKLGECISEMKIISYKYSFRFKIENYRKLEEAFLTCHYQPEYPDIIRKSISNVLIFLERPRSEAELAEIIVKKILERNGETACLYNFIIAINMIDCRRAIKFNDLIRRQASGVINTFNYNCSPDVQQKINVYINDYTQNLQNFLKEKTEIDRIKVFVDKFIKLGQDGGKSFDFRIVEEFYESGEKPEKYHYSEDKDDISVFAIRYFNRFFSEFENFLIDRINITGFGLIKSFSSDIFQLDMDMLRRILTVFEQENYSFPKLSRHEFFELKQARKERNSTAPQLALIQMIDKLSEIIQEIGKKIGQIYLNNIGKNNNNEPEKVKKADDDTSIKSYDSSMPYWNNIILSYGYIKGKTFSQVVSEIAGLCFISALYFYDTRIYAMLEKERKIYQEIEETAKQLERIADAVTYEKIQKLQF